MSLLRKGKKPFRKGNKMSPLRKSLIIALGAIVVIALALFIWSGPLLNALSDELIAKENVATSDVFIVLGGEKNGERTRRAVELYHQDYAGNFLFSDGTRLSWRIKAVDEMTALALSLKVPQARIFTEERSRSTYENALYTKEILLQKGWKSAIVVTTDWHTRRSKLIFDYVFRNSGIKLSYARAKDGLNDDLHEWWKDSEKEQTVLTELASLGIYWLKYIVF